MSRRFWLVAGLVLVWAAAGCTPAADSGTASREGGADVNQIELTSTAFSEGDTIPQEYTCQGEDLSPPLSWSGAPNQTESLALIMDDPDAPAGTWVHWVVFNIAPGVTELAEGLQENAGETSMGVSGANSWRNTGYGGPCPPPGKAHRYFFKLYALDTRLDLPSGASKAQVEKAMQGHILAQGQLMGKFAR